MWPTRITLWPHGLLYIERRFSELYHPRIVHLCNVLEVAPSKWLISKAFISLSSTFEAGYTTFSYSQFRPWQWPQKDVVDPRDSLEL